MLQQKYRNTGNAAFTYDIDNHLLTGSAPTAATFTYDPFGRRWTDTGPTYFVPFIYDGPNLAMEYYLGAVLRRYVPSGLGVDQPLVWYEGAGTSTPRWLQADNLGSVVAYSDASGNQHVTTGYGPFGEVPNFYSARYEYTGQLNIPELSLFDFKARAYDPTLGRFLSADPAGYASDVNSYAYVGNDPVNGTDPSGMAEPQPAKLKSGDGNGGPPCWCYGSGGYGTSGASGWIPYIPPCGGAAGGWDYAAYPDNCPIPGDTVTLNPSGGGVQGGHVGIGTGSTGGGIQLSVSLERHYTSSDFCTALFEAGVFTKQLGQHFEKFGISVASAGMAEVVVVGGPADPLAAPGVVATDLGGETALSGGAGVAIGDAAILATTRHAEGFFGDFLKDAVVDPLPLPEATKAALEDALGDPEEPAGPSC